MTQTLRFQHVFQLPGAMTAVPLLAVPAEEVGPTVTSGYSLYAWSEPMLNSGVIFDGVDSICRVAPDSNGKLRFVAVSDWDGSFGPIFAELWRWTGQRGEGQITLEQQLPIFSPDEDGHFHTIAPARGSTTFAIYAPEFPYPFDGLDGENLRWRVLDVTGDGSMTWRTDQIEWTPVSGGTFNSGGIAMVWLEDAEACFIDDFNRIDLGDDWQLGLYTSLATSLNETLHLFTLDSGAAIAPEGGTTSPRDVASMIRTTPSPAGDQCIGIEVDNFWQVGTGYAAGYEIYNHVDPSTGAARAGQITYDDTGLSLSVLSYSAFGELALGTGTTVSVAVPSGPFTLQLTSYVSGRQVLSFNGTVVIDATEPAITTGLYQGVWNYWDGGTSSPQLLSISNCCSPSVATAESIVLVGLQETTGTSSSLAPRSIYARQYTVDGAGNVTVVRTDSLALGTLGGPGSLSASLHTDGSVLLGGDFFQSTGGGSFTGQRVRLSWSPSGGFSSLVVTAGDTSSVGATGLHDNNPTVGGDWSDFYLTDLTQGTSVDPGGFKGFATIHFIDGTEAAVNISREAVGEGIGTPGTGRVVASEYNIRIDTTQTRSSIWVVDSRGTAAERPLDATGIPDGSGLLPGRDLGGYDWFDALTEDYIAGIGWLYLDDDTPRVWILGPSQQQGGTLYGLNAIHDHIWWFNIATQTLTESGDIAPPTLVPGQHWSFWVYGAVYGDEFLAPLWGNNDTPDRTDPAPFWIAYNKDTFAMTRWGPKKIGPYSTAVSQDPAWPDEINTGSTYGIVPVGVDKFVVAYCGTEDLYSAFETFTDDFERANSSSLGFNWHDVDVQQPPYTHVPFSIVSGAAVGVQDRTGGNVWSETRCTQVHYPSFIEVQIRNPFAGATPPDEVSVQYELFLDLATDGSCAAFTWEFAMRPGTPNGAFNGELSIYRDDGSNPSRAPIINVPLSYTTVLPVVRFESLGGGTYRVLLNGTEVLNATLAERPAGVGESNTFAGFGTSWDADGVLTPGIETVTISANPAVMRFLETDWDGNLLRPEVDWLMDFEFLNHGDIPQTFQSGPGESIVWTSASDSAYITDMVAGTTTQLIQAPIVTLPLPTGPVRPLMQGAAYHDGRVYAWAWYPSPPAYPDSPHDFYFYSDSVEGGDSRLELTMRIPESAYQEPGYSARIRNGVYYTNLMRRQIIGSQYLYEEFLLAIDLSTMIWNKTMLKSFFGGFSIYRPDHFLAATAQPIASHVGDAMPVDQHVRVSTRLPQRTRQSGSSASI